MKLFSKLLITLLFLTFINTAQAARIDTAKPGKDPVHLIHVSEKNDVLTFTFRANKSFHDLTIEGVRIYTTREKSSSENVNYELKKTLLWEFTFKLKKANIDKTTIYIDYDKKGSADNNEKGGYYNVVEVDLSKFYKHYMKNKL